MMSASKQHTTDNSDGTGGDIASGSTPGHDEMEANVQHGGSIALKVKVKWLEKENTQLLNEKKSMEDELKAVNIKLREVQRQLMEAKARTCEQNVVTGPSTNLGTQLAATSSQTAELQRQLDAANKQTADLRKQLEASTKQCTNLQNQLAEANKQISELKKLPAASKSPSNDSKQTSELQQQLVAADRQIKGQQKQLITVSKEMNERRVAALVSKATVVHVIQGRGNRIKGIATLGSQLFIARRDSQQVAIYSTEDFTETGHVTVSDMKYPSSLVACAHHNCLYVSDKGVNCIHRVELSDSSLTKWSVPGQPKGLSLRSRNLVVTLRDTKRIQEYTTSGELIRDINLDVSIDNPRHTIELHSGQYFVCHIGSQLHRLCIVNREGSILRSYGGPEISAVGLLAGPCCLALDTSEHVFVLDSFYCKVRVFSPSLTHLGDVTLPGRQFSKPKRIHFDQLTGRLYISEIDSYGDGLLTVVVASSDR